MSGIVLLQDRRSLCGITKQRRNVKCSLRAGVVNGNRVENALLIRSVTSLFIETYLHANKLEIYLISEAGKTQRKDENARQLIGCNLAMDR